MKVNIFYSWQADLPNNTNRGFIESVISKSISSISRDETFELELCLERDTQGAPGSPNIVKTILEKISTCDIFIADISIVTDGGGNGQRPSPNPNVLFELGYAVSCLSWDRIVLFYNEGYGTDEKLPFDIQQHRRINYFLKPDDMKAPVRDNLTKILKDGLFDITQNLYKTSIVKAPELILDWTYFGYIHSNKTRNGIEKEINRTNMLCLTKAIPSNDTQVMYKKDIDEIKQVDGKNDPNWDQKVKKYISKYDDFITKLDSEINKKNFLIGQNRIHVVSITLALENTGLLPATDIRVEVLLPDWLIAFGKWPEKHDIPEQPVKPIPTPPKIHTQNYAIGQILAKHYDMRVPDITSWNHKRTSACYIKDDAVIMWADKLLHKHELTIEDDNFYLLAMPNSEIGNHKITARIFCVEFDNWKDIELSIKIENEQPNQ